MGLTLPAVPTVEGKLTSLQPLLSHQLVRVQAGDWATWTGEPGTSKAVQICLWLVLSRRGVGKWPVTWFPQIRFPQDLDSRVRRTHRGVDSEVHAIPQR